MRVPLWLKIAYSCWLIVWLVVYGRYYPTVHFLWMCHVGNVILAAAVWLENPLLFSWQAISLLLADLLWTMDILGRLLLGFHVMGGTEYLFDDTIPMPVRAASLFHAVTPWLLIWALWRFGYDRRAIWCQLALCAVLFPLSFIFTTQNDNINWVLGPPFSSVQKTMSPLAFLFVAMIVYSLVVYVPSHLIFISIARRSNSGLDRSPAHKTGAPN